MEVTEDLPSFLINKPRKLDLADFDIGETLGTGSFARVKIGKNKKTNKFYAIKVLKKSELIKFLQVDHILNEIRILYNLDHIFIVKLEGYMQDSKLLYLVQELVNGGELFSLLGLMTKLEIDITKFYAGQIVCIFDYLHSLNIIYRDLKPENILLDKGGYIKLTDFGFAKYCTSRTYTICGTPSYLAPEIILNKGHGRAVDWWTFGVFIYELLVGIDPFADENPEKIYEKILSGKVKFPSNFDKSAKNLIKKLLQLDLSKRYGNLKNGVSDIMNHKFFASINFDKLVNMELKPPYVPRVISDRDVSNFPVYPDSLKKINIVNEKDDPFINW